MKKLRLGIIGLGVMGSAHAQWILKGLTPRVTLTAVCDGKADLSPYAGKAKLFTDSAALIRSGEVDAVLIATPHFSHAAIGIDAFQNGLHVLVEKPITVHKADAEKLIDVAKAHPELTFASMHNMRAQPAYIKLRELIQSGELGTIHRIGWTATAMYRPACYYTSADWRATWAGEGGGMLITLSVHHLDIFQWLFGMPEKIRAHCQFGRHQDIEVDDDVTAYMRFKNGTTATYITSTGEAPGFNRIEIAAERGCVVLESQSNRPGDVIRWQRTTQTLAEFSKTATYMWGKPEHWNIEIPIPAATESPHVVIINNFADAIFDHTPLIAPGENAIRAVELSNAMHMSTFLDKDITLPLDGAAYEKLLNEKIATSRYQKKQSVF